MIRTPLALALLALSHSAQSPCEGNGLGVTLAVSPAYLGEPLSIDVASPLSPGGLGWIAWTTMIGPIDHPLLGPTCFDLFSAPFGLAGVALDGAGEAHVAPLMPSSPALIGAPPIFVSASAIVGAQLGMAKTVPLWFAEHDAWFPAGKLSAPRGFLRATALGDGPTADRIGVFVSGGGDRSLVEPGSKADTWLFEPYTRTFAAGPSMSVPRNFHTQTKLADGRILIAGGCDANGVVHASAEIFDPATNTIAPMASMTAPRAGHAATLLGDGRVFVSGGVADFQNAQVSLLPVLDTAQDTAEIYDPALDAWAAVPATMSSPRTGHGQVLWPDGRVLVIGGIDGGTIVPGGFETASFTRNVDWFGSGAFQPAPLLPHGRAQFAAAIHPDGDLIVAGGIGPFSGQGGAYSDSSWDRFDGVSWAGGAGLVIYSINHPGAFGGLGFATSGEALFVGGFVAYFENLEATAQVSTIDSSCSGFCTATEVAAVGTGGGFTGLASPRGAHAMVELFDGTFLVIGGMNGSSTTPVGSWALDDAWIYAP